MDVPYIPGSAPPPELPLGRFVPPIPEGMVTAWIHQNLETGEPILEPFGFNPLIPIEIAQAGHSVLVTVNNPIHAFMLQILASAPQQGELIAALQDLAVSSKGNERMEPYIRSLYFITCADCNQRIEAEAFLWRKGEKLPYAALVKCPHCGAKGEQSIAEETLTSLSVLPPVRLHQARALNRICSREDPLRSQVKNALNAYLARPLIVLQTIINKLDSLEQSARRRELLIALILSAADQGNTLWSYPSPRNRPRQIVIPSVFQERNLWKVMEKAIESWQYLSSPIPVSDWTGQFNDIPTIYCFRGRLKELTPQIKQPFSTILAAIPRPNQAFWTLSALWTGWIWGQTAVTPIRQVLSRQRYDWNWHTNALSSVFETIYGICDSQTKFWGMIAENEPMLLLASLLAGDSVGFKLLAFAQSYDNPLAQVEWKKLPKQQAHTQPRSALNSAQRGAIQYLSKKSEPGSYQQIQAAAITELAHHNQLAVDTFLENPNQTASETNSLIETLFTELGFLSQVGGGTASLETGEWWLAGGIRPEISLIDHVEETILHHLVKSGTTSSAALKTCVYQNFPGLFTPKDEVILNCLESYAELSDPETHQWTLKESERPSARKADMSAIQHALQNIGQRLDYRVTGNNPLVWEDEERAFQIYKFHILSTAIVTPHIHQSENARINILVIPGSRANLLAFKKQRDQLLKKNLDRIFIIMKFRLVRDLEANPLISRDLFKEQILADPPEYRSSQLALF